MIFNFVLMILYNYEAIFLFILFEVIILVEDYLLSYRFQVGTVFVCFMEYIYLFYVNIVIFLILVKNKFINLDFF